jgi:hypothetical protein
MAGFRFTLKLTPHGRLALEASDDAQELSPQLGRRLTEAFSRGPGFGLLQLGAREVGETVSAVYAYWREFATRFVAALCTRTGVDDVPFAAPDPPRDRKDRLPFCFWFFSGLHSLPFLITGNMSP